MSVTDTTTSSSTIVAVKDNNNNAKTPSSSTTSDSTNAKRNFLPSTIVNSSSSVWEKMAMSVVTGRDGDSEDELTPSELQDYVQLVTLLRIGLPSLLTAAVAFTIYPTLSMALANIINDSGVFAVVSQDSSQYIQNILTTSGLTFSILVGQTYYFMYQQQESIYYALFEEVTVAKSLLEQVALVSQGRQDFYLQMLGYIQKYVRDDLRQLQADPARLLSSRPMNDPLESILYVTSVGEPSVVYQSSVRSLRQARAKRLGALQRKLPQLHMVLLWTLAGIVLFTFPLLGAGSQTIGGPGILKVQAWYLSFIVFGISITIGVIEELRKPAGGAYNVDQVLTTMVAGLEEELKGRLEGKYSYTKRFRNNNERSDSFGVNAAAWENKKEEEAKEDTYINDNKKSSSSSSSAERQKTNSWLSWRRNRP